MPRQTRECGIQDLHPQLRQKIISYIPKGEVVKACCETKEGIGLGDILGTIISFGLAGIPRTVFYAYVITETLIIHSEYGDRDTITSMLLTEIMKFDQYHTKEGGHIVAAKGQGFTGVYCSFASKQIAQNFSQTLGEAIRQAKLTPSRSLYRDGTENIEDRLQKLIELKKNGLISDTEFEQKRRGILDQL